MEEKQNSWREDPSWATNVMAKQMEEQMRDFAQISNAHLEVLPGMDQPVWAMELYVGERSALAILEPPRKGEPRYFYIYYGHLPHKQISDIGQNYPAPLGGLHCEIFSNSIGEVCVEWIK